MRKRAAIGGSTAGELREVAALPLRPATQAGSRETCTVPVPLGACGDDPCDHAFIVHLVARAYGVSEWELSAPSRCGARIAEARQVAIYLAHVACGRSFTDIGESAGRDRTTAAHACQRVEDMRDDRLFDTALDYLEAALHLRGEALSQSGSEVSFGAAEAKK